MPCLAIKDSGNFVGKTVTYGLTSWINQEFSPIVTLN